MAYTRGVSLGGFSYSGFVTRRDSVRYWWGVTPTQRENERRIASALPKPQSTAICLRPRSVPSSWWRTASRRACKTYWDGVLPTSRVNTRSKFRTLMRRDLQEPEAAISSADSRRSRPEVPGSLASQWPERKEKRSIVSVRRTGEGKG